MGILRRGDPFGDPENDRRTFEGIVYDLDMVVTSKTQADTRAGQLYANGFHVIIEPRDAPPEEAMQHLHNRGHVEMHIPIRLDGRTTAVWDIWVSELRRKRRLARRRVHKSITSKTNRKKCKCK
jgi:hypothetical protein